MVNLKGVVNLGVKIRLLEIAVLLNWKLKIPSSEWPLRRCQNEIRDYFQALRLIKLISQLKISKSTQYLTLYFIIGLNIHVLTRSKNRKWINKLKMNIRMNAWWRCYSETKYENFYITEKCSLRCLSGDKADFWPGSPVGSLDQFLMERVRLPYFSCWMLQRKKLCQCYIEPLAATF